ncbi:hypothetical protein SAMN04488564_103242 [Lentzea waywayandensis]|uniref:Uncharacterized protein n=1 Tax=Lentzea waywayandensis TaxID=84724 RepID=A0A1I6DWJ3_9PSEU|nr:hypothetical protein [Lentzea waywayandensis]SFR09823.1 hypothetical protein SAMN04488564_103242 [Lentzea waywayandensis]
MLRTSGSNATVVAGAGAAPGRISNGSTPATISTSTPAAVTRNDFARFPVLIARETLTPSDAGTSTVRSDPSSRAPSSSDITAACAR